MQILHIEKPVGYLFHFTRYQDVSEDMSKHENHTPCISLQDKAGLAADLSSSTSVVLHPDTIHLCCLDPHAGYVSAILQALAANLQVIFNTSMHYFIVHTILA